MKQYFSLFRIRFINGLQYRAAALAGLATQLTWGIMSILAFAAFYRASPENFSMKFQDLVSYIWLQQAFLPILSPWPSGINAIESIVTGNISYDLARPLDIYNRWFFETMSDRISKAMLRSIPVLIIAFILPYPFKMALSANLSQFVMFCISMPISLLVVTAYCQIIYISTFYTMSKRNDAFAILADFFAGAYIPIPFFPDSIKKIVELLPFAGMQNMPLRIYSGDISGFNALFGIALQIFWFFVILVFGRLLMRCSLKRVITQGG